MSATFTSKQIDATKKKILSMAAMAILEIKLTTENNNKEKQVFCETETWRCGAFIFVILWGREILFKREIKRKDFI